jgi:hypothetical protein
MTITCYHCRLRSIRTSSVDYTKDLLRLSSIHQVLRRVSRSSLAWNQINRFLRKVVFLYKSNWSNDFVVVVLWIPEITGFYWGTLYLIFSFTCMFCISLFVLLFSFLLTIVLSVLRLTDSHYIFGIFKIFFLQNMVYTWKAEQIFRIVYRRCTNWT